MWLLSDFSLNVSEARDEWKQGPFVVLLKYTWKVTCLIDVHLYDICIQIEMITVELYIIISVIPLAVVFVVFMFIVVFVHIFLHWLPAVMGKVHPQNYANNLLFVVVLVMIKSTCILQSYLTERRCESITSIHKDDGVTTAM